MKQKKLTRPERTPEAMSAFMRQFASALSDLDVGVGEEFAIAKVGTSSSNSRSGNSKTPGSSADRNELGPFSRDSETSRQAALQNYPKSGTQRWKVLTTIVSHSGMARDQLAEVLHLPDSSVDARVWELKQGGYIEDSDRKVRTRNNAEAAVLVPTDKGRNECAQAEGFTTESMV